MSEAFQNEYLTVSEIARYLQVSLSKAYGLTRQPEFPVCRFGNSVRIPREAFVKWVAKNTYIPNL